MIGESFRDSIRRVESRDCRNRNSCWCVTVSIIVIDYLEMKLKMFFTFSRISIDPAILSW